MRVDQTDESGFILCTEIVQRCAVDVQNGPHFTLGVRTGRTISLRLNALQATCPGKASTSATRTTALRSHAAAHTPLPRRNRGTPQGLGMARAPIHRQTPGRSPPNANRKPRGAGPRNWPDWPPHRAHPTTSDTASPTGRKAAARDAWGSKLGAVLMGRISVKGGSARAPGHSGPILWPPIRRRGDTSPAYAGCRAGAPTGRRTGAPSVSIGQCDGTNPPGVAGRTVVIPTKTKQQEGRRHPHVNSIPAQRSIAEDGTDAELEHASPDFLCGSAALKPLRMPEFHSRLQVHSATASGSPRGGPHGGEKTAAEAAERTDLASPPMRPTQR